MNLITAPTKYEKESFNDTMEGVNAKFLTLIRKY